MLVKVFSASLLALKFSDGIMMDSRLSLCCQTLVPNICGWYRLIFFHLPILFPLVELEARREKCGVSLRSELSSA